MNKKIVTMISSVSNTLCDFSLDIAINRFNEYKVLFYTSIISLLFQIIYAFKVGVHFTIKSIPIILIYGFIMLLGYLCYVKSLKKISIGVAALVENLDLFLVLFIDIICGYIVLNSKFLFMFLLFIFSTVWFVFETNKLKDQVKFKKIKLIGILFIILSVILYTTEPYLIKLASSMGANEVAINFGYSIFAIPFFFIKSRNKSNSDSKTGIGRFGIFLIIAIGLFESIYYICGTIGFIYESPTIVNVIQELRVFLLIILSAIFKMDKLNVKKVIAMMLGIISILILTFS